MTNKYDSAAGFLPQFLVEESDFKIKKMIIDFYEDYPEMSVITDRLNKFFNDEGLTGEDLEDWKRQAIEDIDNDMFHNESSYPNDYLETIDDLKEWLLPLED